MLNININTNGSAPAPINLEKSDEEFSLNNYPRGYQEPAAPINNNVPLESSAAQNLASISPEQDYQTVSPAAPQQQYSSNSAQTTINTNPINTPSSAQNAVEYPSNNSIPTGQPNNVVETDSSSKKFLG
jgi:hypothetical protein